MWLDLLDHGKQIVVILAMPVFVVTRKLALADCEVVALGFE